MSFVWRPVVFGLDFSGYLGLTDFAMIPQDTAMEALAHGSEA